MPFFRPSCVLANAINTTLYSTSNESDAPPPKPADQAKPKQAKGVDAYELALREVLLRNPPPGHNPPPPAFGARLKRARRPKMRHAKMTWNKTSTKTTSGHKRPLGQRKR
mmetsp:Transcript_7230/g.22796  ORF Transcript_7230/g.22796 Transcript_7230/m.22796 type:complete len:110 (-) Transcript_7230:170-499(-)